MIASTIAGDVVVVHPSPQEAQLGLGVRVAPGEGGKVIEALGLRQPGRQVELAVEAKPGGDLGEQVVHRFDADRVEHRRAIRVGGGRIAGQRGCRGSLVTREMLADGPSGGYASSSSFLYPSASISWSELGRIGELYAHEPPLSVGVLVDQLGPLADRLVDRDDLARERRVDVGDGLHRLDLGVGLVLAHRRADLGRLVEDDLARARPARTT